MSNVIGKGLGAQKTWEGQAILPKLVHFYNNFVVPESVSPLHPLGLAIRDLSKTWFVEILFNASCI